MRLPLPGPRDVIHLLERGAEAVELLRAAVPRVLQLLDEAESVLVRVGALVGEIEGTRRSADEVVRRTDAVVARAETTLVESATLADRLRTLLDATGPSLTKLQPTLERLAATVDPHEVDALVTLVDHMPTLAVKLESDIMPVLDSLSTVAPDLHDLLEVSQELNEMLGKLPGMGRIKRRVDEEQEAPEG